MFTHRAGIALAVMIIAAAAPARAASDEKRVSFDSVPGSVQDALTGYGGGASNGASASVWQGTDRGHTVYTGRIVDLDGSTRIIDVDELGRVSSMHQFAAPLVKYFDPGQTVGWSALSPGVQKTIADGSRGAAVTRIVSKKAANGMMIYVATMTDSLGNTAYVETMPDGTLIGVSRHMD